MTINKGGMSKTNIIENQPKVIMCTLYTLISKQPIGMKNCNVIGCCEPIVIIYYINYIFLYIKIYIYI